MLESSTRKESFINSVDGFKRKLSNFR